MRLYAIPQTNIRLNRNNLEKCRLMASDWGANRISVCTVLSMFGILIGEREHVLKYTEIRSRYFKSAREVIVTYKRQSRKFCFSE